MPITQWEFLRAAFVVVGLNLVPKPEQVQEFRREVGTEFVINEALIGQGPGEEVAGRSQALTISRDRITIQSDGRNSFVMMDYPPEQGLDRLSDIAALALSMAGTGDEALQVGYSVEFGYEQDEQQTATGYLADRLFGNMKSASRHLGVLLGGWGRMSFGDGENTWQVVLEPRFQDEGTDRVYFSMNLQRSEGNAPTKEGIAEHLRSAAGRRTHASYPTGPGRAMMVGTLNSPVYANNEPADLLLKPVWGNVNAMIGVSEPKPDLLEELVNRAEKSEAFTVGRKGVRLINLLYSRGSIRLDDLSRQIDEPLQTKFVGNPFETGYALATARSYFDHPSQVEHQTESTICVSVELQQRVMEFVSWLPDWSGHSSERIDCKLATHALLIASDMRRIAGEPFVAPTVDGTLLLQWDFDNDTSIEVYVESDSQFPESAVVDVAGEVSDVRLSSMRDLKILLRKHALFGRPE